VVAALGFFDSALALDIGLAADGDLEVVGEAGLVGEAEGFETAQGGFLVKFGRVLALDIGLVRGGSAFLLAGDQPGERRGLRDGRKGEMKAFRAVGGFRFGGRRDAWPVDGVPDGAGDAPDDRAVAFSFDERLEGLKQGDIILDARRLLGDARLHARLLQQFFCHGVFRHDGYCA